LVGVISVPPGETVAVVHPGGHSVRGVVAWVRGRAVAGILRALPPPESGLLLSLLLGIDTHLPPEVYQQFSRAGLVHLLVVSGAQVAIVGGACLWAARAVRLSLAVATVTSGLGVAVFAGMVEWAPSIGRAVIMTAVGLGASLVGRPRDRAATLAVAALLLLAASPRMLFDIGFQLSFGATWGLLYLSPMLQRAFAWMGPRLAAAAGVSLAAQIAVVPLLAVHFQTVPLAGVLANLLVLPLIGVLVPVGFALMPIVVVAPMPGDALLVLLRPVVQVILHLGQWFGTLSWASVPIPPVSGAMAALFMLALGGGVAVGSGTWVLSHAMRWLAAAIAVLVVGVWYGVAAQPPSFLTVTVLDVGQGEAILVQSPAGRAMLIDGGGEVGSARSGWDIGRMRVVPALRRAGVRRLDAMLLSHPHEDHVGGLPAVLENLPVGSVLDPGVAHPSPSYLRLLRAVEAGRVPYRIARAGMLIDLGAGVSLAVLYPPEPIPVLDGDRVHAGAVIARLALGHAAMLLTGDAEVPAERYLLDRAVHLSSQVLKVGHHGSRTSTSPAFVAAVRPAIAVISVGADNRFGHPHPATLRTLADAAVVVYRTDRDGAIRLETGGHNWRVTTMRAERRGGLH
jgi:competence protein ComEC